MYVDDVGVFFWWSPFSKCKTFKMIIWPLTFTKAFSVLHYLQLCSLLCHMEAFFKQGPQCDSSSWSSSWVQFGSKLSIDWATTVCPLIQSPHTTLVFSPHSDLSGLTAFGSEGHAVYPSLAGANLVLVVTGELVHCMETVAEVFDHARLPKTSSLGAQI